MKYTIKIIFSFLMLALFFSACHKVAELSNYSNGSAPVISASTASIAPAPSDSLKTVVTFSWTNPKYSTDTSTVKYIIQVDSSGRNFSKAVSRTVTGQFTTTYTAKEINNILLGYGFNFGVAYDMDVRIISSYGNNNEQYISNTLKVKMTPYKIPPKIAPPASGRLFIVGDATQGGWNNPVPVPTQELTKIDSVTYGGIFDLTGGKEYLILPVNGDWGTKYSVADKTVTALNKGGDFGLGLSDNFPGPATTGRYQVIFDFQKGKFTVTPYTKVLPDSLYMVGDATAGGWNNPVPVPSQKFTRVNSSKFSITVPMTGGKEYLMLPLNGDWGHKFAVSDKTVAGLSGGGDFGYDKNDNFPAPSASATYKVDVDFLTYKFLVTKQ